MENTGQNGTECYGTLGKEPGKPIPSAVMFSAGVVSISVALVLLAVRRRRSSMSLYQVLVTAILMTDLLGSVSVSPVVLSAYAQRKSLTEMSAYKEVCLYFGFSMTFLSLSTLAILCVMALERYLSIGHPYFYEEHISKRCGFVTIGLIYLGSILFCVTPFMGFGQYVQYCPGTWCFLDMRHMDGEHNNKVVIGFYASIILVMISTTVVCNMSVIYHLVMMYRRGKVRKSGVSAQSGCHRSLSMSEELEHLVPLVIITVVYVCCTFPLVLRVYINLTRKVLDQQKEEPEEQLRDLRALRLLSFHSIINPWVLIILRPSLLKTVWKKLHRPQKSTFNCEKTLSAQAKQAGGSPRCAAPEAGK